jgi:hypothetical protein
MRITFVNVLLLCMFCAVGSYSKADAIVATPGYARGVHYSVVASNGMTLGFFANSTNVSAPELVNQPILICFGNFPTNVAIIYVPIDNYLAHIRLFDMSGKEVEKTLLGNKFGYKENLRWDEHLMRHQHGQIEPWGVVEDKWTDPLRMPSVDQLFNIREHEKYRLIIETQVFVPRTRTNEVVKFPPLIVPVLSP